MDVRVRKISKNDFDFCCKLWQNELVRKHLGGIADIARIEKNFSNMISANEAESLFYIVEDELGNQAGLISIDSYHEKNSKELSYQFLPEYWGKGIAFQAIQSFIEKAKVALKITELYAETQKVNQRSRKLLERLGMKKIMELERFDELQVVYKLYL